MNISAPNDGVYHYTETYSKTGFLNVFQYIVNL